MLKPVVLLILDGWGIAPPGPGNAISKSQAANINRFSVNFPTFKITASGQEVGLPKGEPGNTETGHLNLGAGQIVFQDLPRINQAIASGVFFQNQAFLQAIKHIKDFRSNLHFIGLVSSGSVHSSNEHLMALLKFAKDNQLDNVYLHLFTDGRDSPPTSALSSIESIQSITTDLKIGQIATIMGRYWGLDRDLRWERTQIAYQALTDGVGSDANSAQEAIKTAYSQNLTDEFIKPTIILDNKGKSLPRIKNNDSIIFFNFRIDRPRQLTKAFVLPNFETYQTSKSFDHYHYKHHQKQVIESSPSSKPFQRKTILSNLTFVTMTEYEKGLPVTVAFPPKVVTNPLGKIISENKLSQLRISETEKERFVTYYFNGLREDPFPQEDRIIIPSVKVSTYDLEPEMSADQITQTMLERTALSKYDFIVVNFANADIVAHSGNISATVKACQVVDKNVGKIVLNILGQGGAVLITADHGNAESLISPVTGEVDTEHSSNPVPLIIAANYLKGKKAASQQGLLADIAPTILKLMGIPKPNEMTGKSLI